MTLRSYKFVVQAIVQQVDEDGNVAVEVQSEPVVIFGTAALEQWARDFPNKRWPLPAPSRPISYVTDHGSGRSADITRRLPRASPRRSGAGASRTRSR